MNERIRELKLEAANWARQNHRAVDPQNLTMQEYEQRVLMMTDKFAELIVRECANQCGNVLDYHAILERFGFEFKWSQE
jgi:hypothetical protein